MSPLDHQLHRLFKAAAQAPRAVPAMPLGFATRVLALAAPAGNGEAIAAIFRYALGIGCAGRDHRYPRMAARLIRTPTLFTFL